MPTDCQSVRSSFTDTILPIEAIWYFKVKIEKYCSFTIRMVKTLLSCVLIAFIAKGRAVVKTKLRNLFCKESYDLNSSLLRKCQYLLE